MLLLILSSASWGADPPVGDADKSMYALYARFGADLGGGLSHPGQQDGDHVKLGLGAAVSDRTALRGTYGSYGYTAYSDADEHYELLSPLFSVGVDVAPLGQVSHGWLLTGEAQATRIETWQNNTYFHDLRRDVKKGVLPSVGLGTAYQWIAHPGLLFRMDLGVETPFAPTNGPAPRLRPTVGMATGWAFTPKGPPPKPGYRSWKNTKKVKPELIIAPIGAGLLASAWFLWLTSPVD